MCRGSMLQADKRAGSALDILLLIRVGAVGSVPVSPSGQESSRALTCLRQAADRLLRCRESLLPRGLSLSGILPKLVLEHCRCQIALPGQSGFVRLLAAALCIRPLAAYPLAQRVVPEGAPAAAWQDPEFGLEGGNLLQVPANLSCSSGGALLPRCFLVPLPSRIPGIELWLDRQRAAFSSRPVRQPGS